MYLTQKSYNTKKKLWLEGHDISKHIFGVIVSSVSCMIFFENYVWKAQRWGTEEGVTKRGVLTEGCEG